MVLSLDMSSTERMSSASGYPATPRTAPRTVAGRGQLRHYKGCGPNPESGCRPSRIGFDVVENGVEPCHVVGNEVLWLLCRVAERFDDWRQEPAAIKSIGPDLDEGGTGYVLRRAAVRSTV